MKRMTYLLLAIVIISSFCISSTAYAGLIPTQEEKKVKREASIKEVKDVDLPVLRDRAKFLKQKIEELQAKGQKKISSRDTLIEGVNNILYQMFCIESSTGLPTRTFTEAADRVKSSFGQSDINQVVLKLEEIITIINSIIGPEKAK